MEKIIKRLNRIADEQAEKARDYGSSNVARFLGYTQREIEVVAEDVFLKGQEHIKQVRELAEQNAALRAQLAGIKGKLWYRMFAKKVDIL